MKRFLLILLALGLTWGFSAAVFAADVKFSGQFYAAGMYVDKTDLRKDYGNSTAFYFQRLRVQTDFIVSSSLKLVTRFDAMERAWGAPRSAAGAALDIDSAGTVAENENIAFDWAYINYKSPIGVFDVGIMNDGSTGTIFGNSTAPAGRIKYSYTMAPFTLNLAYTKVRERSHTAKLASNFTDADNDKYGIEGVYRWKDSLAAVQVNYYHYRANRPLVDGNYRGTYYLVTPYTVVKIGPVKLQAELNYAFGKIKDYEDATPDVKLRELSGWIDALADFGMFYAGGTFAYVSGNKPDTTKQEGGQLSGGRDWNPCLILFSYYDTYYWAGAIRGWDPATTGVSDVNNAMKNAFFYQGRVGVRPIANLDIMASLAYAYADKKPTGYLEKDYGIEFDLTATYKITNNLSYMLGAGYLWTGDYFKYNNDANKIDDNFMVINKLTLTF